MSQNNIDFDMYGKENRPKKRKIFGIKFLIFVCFIFVMGIILMTTIYKDFSFGSLGDITGKVIFWSDGNSRNFDVSMQLSVPELNLKGDYTKIVIEGISSSLLSVGNHDFSLLGDSLSEVSLEDFSGKIHINENSIEVLEGKVSGIIVNGMPISDRSGKKIKVSSESPLFYNFLEFEDELNFKKIDYNASGKISWGENLIRLNNERVEIINFLGKMKIQNKIMNLEGVVGNVRGKDFRAK
jgi:hypothetical protein